MRAGCYKKLRYLVDDDFWLVECLPGYYLIRRIFLHLVPPWLYLIFLFF